MNYFDTYAPVVSFTAVRCFLAFVAHADLHCDQMDVVTAFLKSNLKETIYMDIPSGFMKPETSGKVCPMHKAIYGLKQASKQWYAKMNSFLVDELQFTCCPDEPCMYHLQQSREIIVLILYVDDLLIAGSKRKILDEVKSKFCSKFKMKDMGEAEEFLGINIWRNLQKEILQLSQKSYIERVLDRFMMSDAKGAANPKKNNIVLSKRIRSDPPLQAPYREALGCIMYLMVSTRPHIAYAVGRQSQFSENC